MHWLLTMMAVLVGFGYSMYVAAILKGDADLTETGLLASLSAWMEEQGEKSKRKIWLAYWGSLLFEAAYLYFAYSSLENVAFQILTSCVLGVEVYVAVRLFQRLHGFFGGQVLLADILPWKAERISALALFTHAVVVLLFPITTWF